MADGTLQSLRERVDATIASAGQGILDRVHDHYVDTERERRAQVIITSITALRAAEADLKKINRPDSPFYGEDGALAQSLYTKGRLNDIKKGKERVEKLAKALDKVVQSNDPEDYKKLEDISKKGGRSDPAPSGADAEEE